MNYNMQRDNENNSQALRDAEINEGRNQEKHQVLMVDKTTNFKKKGQREEGELQEERQASFCSSEEAQVWT